MSDENGKPSQPSDMSNLDELEQRLETARKKHSGEIEVEHDNSILGMAMRISTELVVTVLVGCALGLGIDTLANTKPLFMIVGLVLGTVTALRNIFRLVARMEEAERKKLEAKNKP